MALRLKSRILQFVNVLHRSASTGVASTSGGNEKQSASSLAPLPKPGTLKDNELVFDEKTHTGQVKLDNFSKKHH